MPARPESRRSPRRLGANFGATAMRHVRRTTIPFALPILVWSCSAAPPPVVPDPMDAVRAQLAQAQDLTQRGCYRCLIEARDLYEEVGRQGFVPETANAGLLRTTLLIGMREREMGLPGGGTFERTVALAGLEVAAAEEMAEAREAAEAEEDPAGREAGEARQPPEAEDSEETAEGPAGREAGEARQPLEAGDAPETVAGAESAEGGELGEAAGSAETASAGPEWETFLQIAATTPWQDVGIPKDLAEENVYARAIADRDRDAWNRVLRPLVPTDPLAAYLYLSLNCTSEWLAEQPPELAEVLAVHDDAVYVRYRQALCADEQVALASIQTIEPRFTEMELFLGRHALEQGRGPQQGDVALAEFHYARAREEWPEWPAPAMALGEVARTVEDYEASLPFYDAALALVPEQRDALLGRAQSLSYLDRNAEAVPLLDRLIGMGRWYLAEAHFWRAYNRFNLGDVEGARDDAATSIGHRPEAQSYALSGQIALVQRRLDDARSDLETALDINPQYCYAAFHLGRVHIEEARWIETASAFSRAALCFRANAAGLAADLSEIEQNPDLAEDRRARLVARRTDEIAVVRQQAASSFYNAALGYYNDGVLRLARRYAEIAAEHEMFAERSTRLLGLIANVR